MSNQRFLHAQLAERKDRSTYLNQRATLARYQSALHVAIFKQLCQSTNSRTHQQQQIGSMVKLKTIADAKLVLDEYRMLWCKWVRQSQDSKSRQTLEDVLTNDKTSGTVRAGLSLICRNLATPLSKHWSLLTVDRLILVAFHVSIHQYYKSRLVNSSLMFLHSIVAVMSRAPIQLVHRLYFVMSLYDGWTLPVRPVPVRLDHSDSAALVKSATTDVNVDLHPLVLLFLSLHKHDPYQIDALFQMVIEYLWITYTHDVSMSGATRPDNFLDLLLHIRTDWLPSDSAKGIDALQDSHWTTSSIDALTQMHLEVYQEPSSNVLDGLTSYLLYSHVAECMASCFIGPASTTSEHRHLSLLYTLFPIVLECQTRSSTLSFVQLARGCWTHVLGQRLETMPQLPIDQFIVPDGEKHTLLVRHVTLCNHLVHWHSIATLGQVWRATSLYVPLLQSCPLICDIQSRWST